MKPRFSILALMGIMAYVAVHIAGLTFPLSWWNSISFYLWVLLVAWASIEAFSSKSKRSAFAGGLLMATLSYCAAASFEGELSAGLYGNNSGPHIKMPHDHLEHLLDQSMDQTIAIGLPPVKELLRKEAIHRSAVVLSSIALGLLGGCLALWRYRRLERREKACT